MRSIGSADLPHMAASVCTLRTPLRIRRDIIERTDGIPLFVEEMTKAVLEAGSVG